MSLQVGAILAHYRIVEKIGEGGMGMVYKAFDTRLERDVALKVLRPEMASDPDRLARFEREAKAVAALNHPNIASIHQIEEAGGHTFIVMELIEGQSLRQRIGRKPLPLDALLDLAIQIAEGLEAAHTKGIMHRDIKPANVLVTVRDRIKLLDFGLAKLVGPEDDTAGHANSIAETEIRDDQHLTSPGATLGTIAYMSPEQVRGEELDPRTDLFSFGALLYEMATGRNAFAGATSGLVFDAILNRDPAPASQINPDAPARLEQVIEKALEKDRALRYQRAAEIRTDLARLKRDTDSGRARVPVALPVERRERHAAPPPQAQPRRRVRRPLLAALAAVAALAAGALVWKVASRSEPIDAGGPIDSIAVLPFESAGGSADSEYISDGITESLINSLSKLRELRVVPRTLVFPFKGRQVNPSTAGRELKVRAVVTGRVTQRGESLIVGAELIDVAQVAQIWGQQYTRTVTDLFAVQEEIAREISRNLRLKLSPSDERRISRRYTEDPEAYELYIKSLQEVREGDEGKYDKAIVFLKKAIVQDLKHRSHAPDGPQPPGGPQDLGFALAYEALARAHTLQAFEGLAPPREAYAEAKAAAQFALGMDEGLAGAHGSLAFLKFFYEWDWPGAEQEYRRALEIDPEDDEIHKNYSAFLMAMGRTTEAIGEMKRARELDPRSEELSGLLAEQYFWVGRLDEALRQVQETLELDPESPRARLVSAYLHSARGSHPEAIDSYLDYLSLTDRESPLSPTLAYFYAAAGRREAALGEIRKAAPGQIAPAQLAWVHAALGEKDKAFAWLEKAYEQRAVNLLWIKTQPWFAPLRSDARYAELERRMRLPG